MPSEHQLNRLLEEIDQVSDEKKHFVMNPLISLTRKIAAKLPHARALFGSFVRETCPQIVDQLDAAEKRTEFAASDIMQAAENLIKISNNLPEALRNLVRAEANKILETASFQDLVAQHINEARMRAKAYNEKAEALEKFLEDNGRDSEAASLLASDKGKKNLLNGPSTKVK